MRWSYELPTKPGYYWWQGGKGSVKYIVKIHRDKRTGKLVSYDLSSWNIDMLGSNVGRWAGPILIPEPKPSPWPKPEDTER